MWKILLDNLPTIITLVLGLAIVSRYIGRVLRLLKELSELLTAVLVALTDKKLTRDEINTIVKEAGDLSSAIKALFSKRNK